MFKQSGPCGADPRRGGELSSLNPEVLPLATVAHSDAEETCPLSGRLVQFGVGNKENTSCWKKAIHLTVH